MSMIHLALALTLAATAAAAPATSPPPPTPGPSGLKLQVATGARDPSVAFDAASGLSAVTWWDASGNVFAQRMRNGSAFGAPITVASGTQPRVASIQSRSAFVVVYTVGPELRVRAIDAGDGSLSNELVIATGFTIDYQIGGESSSSGDGALVLSSSLRLGTRLDRIEVDAAGTVSRPAVKSLSIQPSSEIALSPRGGPNDQFLLIWELSRMNGRVFGGDLRAGPSFDLGAAEFRRNHPRAAGDGISWTVVQQRDRYLAWGFWALEVTCSVVSVAQGRAVSGASRVIDTYLLPEPRDLDPTVAFLGESSLAGYLMPGLLGHTNVITHSVDALQCTPCEGRFFTGIALESSTGIEIAGEGRGGRGATLVWLEGSTLMAQGFVAVDGRVTDLGGGCFVRGDAVTGCARGNLGGFRMHLRATSSFSPGAPPPALANISLGRQDLPCAPCTLFPATSGGMVIPVSASPGQFYSLFVPVGGPSGLRGKVVYVQWVVPGPGCRSLGAAMSNGLEVRLE